MLCSYFLFGSLIWIFHRTQKGSDITYVICLHICEWCAHTWANKCTLNPNPQPYEPQPSLSLLYFSFQHFESSYIYISLYIILGISCLTSPNPNKLPILCARAYFPLSLPHPTLRLSAHWPIVSAHIPNLETIPPALVAHPLWYVCVCESSTEQPLPKITQINSVVRFDLQSNATLVLKVLCTIFTFHLFRLNLH